MQHEFSFGLVLRRSGRGEELLCDHVLGQVVEALEVAATGDREPSVAEHRLERPLPVGPDAPKQCRLGVVRPVDRAPTGVLQVGEPERPTSVDLVDYLLDVAGSLALEASVHRLPVLLVAGILHTPAEEPVHVGRDDRSRVSVVFERLAP